MRGAGERLGQRAAGEDLGQVGAVRGTGVLVAEQGGLAAVREPRHLRRRRCQGVGGGIGADQHPFCLPGAVRAGRDPVTATSAPSMRPSFSRSTAQTPGQRQVAGRVRELLVGAAPGARAADADVRDDLVLGEVGGVDALEEVVEGDLSPADVRQVAACAAAAAARDPPRACVSWCLPLREAIVTVGVECEQDRGQVGRWVAVRHRAADRAPGADLGVGEDREGVGHGRDDASAPCPVRRWPRWWTADRSEPAR